MFRGTYIHGGRYSGGGGRYSGELVFRGGGGDVPALIVMLVGLRIFYASLRAVYLYIESEHQPPEHRPLHSEIMSSVGLRICYVNLRADSILRNTEHRSL